MSFTALVKFISRYFIVLYVIVNGIVFLIPLNCSLLEYRNLSSVWAVITNYCKLGGLNNKQSFLIVLEAGKSKIKVLTDAVFGEDLLSWFSDGGLVMS
jgi:hypothetical protein